MKATVACSEKAYWICFGFCVLERLCDFTDLKKNKTTTKRLFFLAAFSTNGKMQLQVPITKPSLNQAKWKTCKPVRLVSYQKTSKLKNKTKNENKTRNRLCDKTELQ